VLYGPGGVGKTTLAAGLPGPVFFDLDDSLGQLGLDMPIVTASTWTEFRSKLNMPGWDNYKSILIDTLTRGEEMGAECVVDTIPDDGKKVASVSHYTKGKGYGYLFDMFIPLLGDLDRHVRAGRNVVLICHDCIANVPNPTGEDWIRYEPRLQSPASGKSSIRLRVREWADHVLFLGYDVAVTKDGKGVGAGSRTLYRAETPAWMAKSRTGSEPIPVEKGNETEIWKEIIR
jgi:hypothetical protein